MSGWFEIFRDCSLAKMAISLKLTPIIPHKSKYTFRAEAPLENEIRKWAKLDFSIS